ncbi:MAG: GIY-YIG nuclease family protein [Bacillota bacterium]|jgi:putative endonuclease
MPYTYMVRCRDNSLYTGWAADVEKRVKTHNSGKGAKYTRGRLPVELVWCCYVDDKIMAQKLEWAVKKLSKKRKELLVINPGLIKAFCADIWEAEHAE